MLIAILFLVKMALSEVIACFGVLLNPIMIITIILAGVVIAFAAVGVTISINLSSTFANRVFDWIESLCKVIVKASCWIVCNVFKIIPIIFLESKRLFSSFGIKGFTGNLMSFIVVIIVLLVII